MHNNFRKKLLIFTSILELFIAILIVVAVVFSVASLVMNLWGFTQNYQDPGAFSLFVGYAFNTIIGIEFLKMLLKHSTGSVIEVLLFAIARQLIVEHTSSLENLLGILAIAVLFVIRKFLYVSTFDDESEHSSDPLALLWKKFQKKEVLMDEEDLIKTEKVRNH